MGNGPQMIRIIGLLLIVTVMATDWIKAQAHITTGNELLNFCQSGASTNSPDVMVGVCYGLHQWDYSGI